MIRRALILAVIVFGVPALASDPPLKVSGQVVDEEGKPIKGARACLVVLGEEGLCYTTGERGHFMLPAARAATLAVVHSDYLPRRLAAVDQPAPIVLVKAASIHVRAVDRATDEAVAEGKIFLDYTTGVRKGPLPMSVGGVIVNSLPPGDVLVTVEAEGFGTSVGIVVQLVAGERAETVVPMTRVPEKPAPLKEE